jgi:hypothetical protein
MRRTPPKRSYFRPRLEPLEDRRLLAQVLFGGDVLKETFDDPENMQSPPGQFLPSAPGTFFDLDSGKLDDLGVLAGQQVGPVFHHTFTPAPDNAELQFSSSIGTTQAATREGILILGRPGSDDIIISPFLPPGATKSEVALAAIDVAREFTSVTFWGRNGTETLKPAPLGAPPSLILTQGSPGGSGSNLVLGPPTINNWDTLAASEDDPLYDLHGNPRLDANGNPITLGPITQIFVNNGNVTRVDNLRALVFFPGIAVPPSPVNDVFELPRGAPTGQSFQSKDIIVPSGTASVLGNDSTPNKDAMGNPLPLTAKLVSGPAHDPNFASEFNSDGTFTYTPDSTFTGTDSFTYVANDGIAESNLATVYIFTKGNPTDTDGDGVPDAVEAAVSPSGDGNGDGTPDWLESTVASLPGADGQYWTLVTSTDVTKGQGFANVSNVGYAGLPRLPYFGTNLPAGLFSFQIRNLHPGDSAVVRLTPQTGTNGANGFFVLDSFSNTFLTFTDATVTGTDITLNLTDGKFGDFDGNRDGVISFVGGPVTGLGTPLPAERVNHPPVATKQYFPLIYGLGDPGGPPATLTAGLLSAPRLIYGLPSGNVQGPIDQNDKPAAAFAGDTLTVRITTRPTHGTLSAFNPVTGDFTYTPDTPDVFGADSFGYVVNDGNQDSAENFVSIGQTLATPLAQKSKYYKIHAGSFVYESGIVHGLLSGADLPNLLPLAPFISHITLDTVSPQNSFGVLADVAYIQGTHQYPIEISNPTDFTLNYQPVVPGEDLNLDGNFFYFPRPPFAQYVQFTYHDAYEVLSNPSDTPNNTPKVSVLLIPLQPGVSTASGIPDAVEAAGPNGGDGNGDGIPDNQQDNVASLPDATDGNYVTLASPDGTALVSVTAQSNPSPSDAPAGVAFPAGFFNFTIAGVAPGGATTVTMILPPGETIEDYWQFGPTPDVVNPDGSHPPHWYEWLYDPTTGIGAQLVDSSGNLLRDASGRQEIILHHVDGQIGDSDLTVNGIIRDPSAPAIFIPVAHVTGPAAGVRGQPLTFTASATDLSPAKLAAGFTYRIDWGDGSPVQVIGATPGNGSGVSVDHVFSSEGNYTVTLTATDKAGFVSDVVSQKVTITPFAFQDDPLYHGKTMLVIGGTTGDDRIQIAELRFGTPQVAFMVNGQLHFVAEPSSRIVVYGQAGNDWIDAGQTITPAWLYGGDGNDSLFGGQGNDVLVGGDGNDLLNGGGGRNLIIGGGGADVIFSAFGEDIVIGGFTSYDDRPAALAAIMAEWTSSNDYTTRVAHLRGDLAGGMNGSVFLKGKGPDATVFDDSASDTLMAGPRQSWMFATLDGPHADVVRALGKGDIVDGLDPVL